MIVASTPILHDRRCFKLRFLSSLRTPKVTFKNPTSQAAYYNLRVDRYIDKMNSKFVGNEYTKLTGRKIEHEVMLQLATSERLASVRVCLTCPLQVDPYLFQNFALTTWKSISVAGEHVFVDDVGAHKGGRPAPGWWQRTFGA